jgi:hypothetical protein
MNGRRIAPRTPSASFVVALAALLVALGGSSAAAVSFALPRDSVGTPQLRASSVTSAKIAAGAVTSADVRDRSLLTSDFAPGQIPAGPAGPAGPPGPSDGHTAFVRGPTAISIHTEAQVVSLAIPEAGSYVVLAKALVSGRGTVTCRLEAEGDFDLSQATPAASANQTIEAVVPHAFASPGSVAVKCVGESDAAASFVRIAALKVGSLTTSG